ncbi:MAG: hypothetical protein ACTHMC_27400 [Pseudobacter sp.]|uniref:hypothetical protein n=1 Tax=Pseudobacter sp. TaxID=2045420 RepID=UPI003F7F3D07
MKRFIRESESWQPLASPRLAFVSTPEANAALAGGEEIEVIRWDASNWALRKKLGTSQRKWLPPQVAAIPKGIAKTFFQNSYTLGHLPARDDAIQALQT